MKPYKVVGTHIELTDTPYEGIIYRYGKVSLIEENDHLKLQFEYDIVDGSPPNDEIFKTYIGDILLEMIEEGLSRNDIVYTGGTD